VGIHTQKTNTQLDPTVQALIDAKDKETKRLANLVDRANARIFWGLVLVIIFLAAALLNP